MKIVIVVDIGYVAGGAEKSAKLIRDSLVDRGHEVLVLSTTRNAVGKPVFADVMVPAIEGSAPIRLWRCFWNQDSYRVMRHIVRDFRPDIVHVHTVSEFSPSIIWGIGKTPAVLTVHGPEEFTLRLIPWLLPASDYDEGTYDPKDILMSGRLRYIYYRFLQRPAWRLALRHIRLVISPSIYMADASKSDFPRKPSVQIYNGISLPKRRSLNAKGARTILYVGRLEAVKGIDHLIKAFKATYQKNNLTRLRIVGEGSQLNDLKKLTRELNLDDVVKFAGWVEPKKIADEFAAATIVAIPSVWPENLPTVAIEALAVGRPIVGSNTGGISELIEDGINGRLVAPGDDTALANAFCDILENQKLLKSAAAASAAKAKSFDEKLFIDRLIEIYGKESK